MIADYSLVLYRPDGVALGSVSGFLSWESTRTVNDLGGFSLSLPEGALPVDALARASGAEELIGSWITVHRGVGALSQTLFETAWVVRKVRKARVGGESVYQLSGYSALDVLGTRHILYYAGTGGAQKSGPADDLIKAIVRENFVSSTSPVSSGRDIPSGSFSVEGDLGLGPSLGKGFAWRNVLKVIQDLCQESYAHATTPLPLYVDLVPVQFSPLKFELRVFPHQRGRDRTSGEGYAEFSLERGNLTEVTLEIDYTEEANVVIALGQGEGEERDTAEAQDTGRSGRGPFARRERVVEATMVERGQLSQLQEEARRALHESRPRVRFNGRIQETEGSRMGVHWDWGDKVIGRMGSTAYTCRINTCSVKVEGGMEEISAQLANDDG